MHCWKSWKGDTNHALCCKTQIFGQNSASWSCEKAPTIVFPEKVHVNSWSCKTEQIKADLWQRFTPGSSLPCGRGLWTQGSASRQGGVAEPESAEGYYSFAKLHPVSKVGKEKESFWGLFLTIKMMKKQDFQRFLFKLKQFSLIIVIL